VPAAEPIRLRVEVDRDLTPVTGRVVAEDRRERPFAGWTELFAALEALIADDESGQQRSPRTPTTQSTERNSKQ
jgi:hypothetical protein